MDPKGLYSRGYLPHFDSPVQFVTFRLADSLPKALAMLPDNLAQTDERLVAGWSACWLGRSEIAQLIEGALLFFDKDRYRLLA
jgi:putative transposase